MSLDAAIAADIPYTWWKYDHQEFPGLLRDVMQGLTFYNSDSSLLLLCPDVNNGMPDCPMSFGATGDPSLIIQGWGFDGPDYDGSGVNPMSIPWGVADMTWEFFFKLHPTIGGSGLSNDVLYLDRTSPHTTPWVLYISARQPFLTIRNDASFGFLNFAAGGGPVASNVWHHFTVHFQTSVGQNALPKNYLVTLDGVVWDSGVYTNNIVNNTSNSISGGVVNKGVWLRNFVTYHRYLTAAQAIAHYQAMIARCPKGSWTIE